jgi:hypothetical protein
VVVALAASACGSSAPSAETPGPSAGPSTSASSSAASWNYVAFGDSWPEGAHCGGCRTFAGLWADGLERITGRTINFTDLTGSHEPSVENEKTSASLLESLKSNLATQSATEAADIILISTGANEFGMALDASKAGTCGGQDKADCIRALGDLWNRNFDAILTQIGKLRAGKPTAIRLVDAANGFVSDASLIAGLPAGFAKGNGALIFQLLNNAMCGAAKNHHAVCVDVRPILNGPTMDQPVDEVSSASMQTVADALLATKLPELH